jgi:4-hydroxyphenylpyruvate dioxygenase
VQGVEFYQRRHTYYQAIPERLGEHMKMMKEDQ